MQLPPLIRVLHSWRPAILKHGAAKYLEDYDARRREVKELGDKVAKAYGETFSLADHKYKHGLYRNSFVEALPDLVDAEKCWEAEPHRQAAVELAHQLFDKK